MDRYGISLGKKSQARKKTTNPIKFSESNQTRAAKGMNFSMTGPNGFRCMFPASNLTLIKNGDVLNITGSGIQLILTGSLANQMYEDFQGYEEGQRPAGWQRLNQRPANWSNRGLSGNFSSRRPSII